VSDEQPDLPDGFAVGHWTDVDAATGCTVVIPPVATSAGVDVRGGGPGTRETDVVGPLANPQEVTAVLLTGGSAHGLAAADGVVRWCEEHGRGYRTPGGLVPLVPAAVVYDLVTGSADVRPGPEQGYAACEAARGGVPARGRVGAGTGAAVAKARGREHATAGGVGYAAGRTGAGASVGVIAVANSTGDVLGKDGELLAGPRGEDGEPLRGSELLAAMPGMPSWTAGGERENTTLVCVCTDAALGKLGANKVARMASAGIARAVDPVYTPFDGDVVFCLASGVADQVVEAFTILSVGTVAATLTSDAIRDAVLSARE
jgi:L-aminopeptidase/D-esterase-like protein